VRRERFIFFGKKKITDLPTYTTLYLSRTRESGSGWTGRGWPGAGYPDRDP